MFLWKANSNYTAKPNEGYNVEERKKMLTTILEKIENMSKEDPA